MSDWEEDASSGNPEKEKSVDVFMATGSLLAHPLSVNVGKCGAFVSQFTG